MYGHTNTMKQITELIDALRGTIGVEAQGGWARNPPQCSNPRKWFHVVKLLADLGLQPCLDAIRDEATHVMLEIDKQTCVHMTNNLVPEAVYLGAWESLVMMEWQHKSSRIIIQQDPQQDWDSSVLMYIHVVCGELPIKNSDAESHIEVTLRPHRARDL